MAAGDVIGEVQRYFPFGMDSYSMPDQLGPGEYHFGLNIVCRGGLPQTRPGTTVLSCLPDGNLQGFTVFTPANGIPHHVAAVDGVIYVSAPPFQTWRRLPNLQFWSASRFVAFQRATKSTDYDANGEFFFLDTPYDVLMIQDGRTRAGFWDGSVSRHLNPTPSGSQITQEGFDETTIGLWMTFSGERLWVARGREVYALDLGNPLKATERQYLNEAPAFFLPGDCTGMRDEPDLGGLIAFHANGAEFIESSIQDRTEWLQTPNMIRTIFRVGCVAPRSIVELHGMLYWFSPFGFIRADDAYRTNHSSTLTILDQEMAWSKAYIGPDLEGIAGGAFENYLVQSVPFCDKYNRHTWAMDLAVFEESARAWNAVWTGWRPVEWATAKVHGMPRCFFASRDMDGHNRVWEAFLPDRRDNGCAITCSCQFRLDPIRKGQVQKFLYAKIEAAQCFGDLSVMAAVAGRRGWFDRIMTKEVVASPGRVFYDDTYGDGTRYPTMGANRPQMRVFKTEQWPNPNPETNACGVESTLRNNIDTHFQLFVGWSGRMGVSGIQLFASEIPEAVAGDCEPDESEFNTLMATGPASKDKYPTARNPFPQYVGIASKEGPGLENSSPRIYVEICARSQISQADANRKAACFATRQYARLAVDPDLLPFESSFGCTTIVVQPPPSPTPGAPVLTVYQETVLGPPELLVLNEDQSEFVSEVDFGTIGFNQSPQDVILTLKNAADADADLVLGLLSIAGDVFSLLAQPSQTTLAPGESTQITVRCTWDSDFIGVNNGTLTIPSNDPLSPHTIPLTAELLLPD